MKEFLKRWGICLGFGFLAGLAISLGATAAIYIKATGVNDPSSFTSFISAFVFGFGIFLICICGFYLYTGRIGYIFENKKSAALNLIPIYIGNIIGVITIGYLMYGLTKDSTDIQSVLTSIITPKLAGTLTAKGSGILFGKAVMCGFCVFLAVHLYKNLKNPGFKYLGLLLPIMVFVLCGFEHCIANGFYLSMGNAWSVQGILNIVYVTLGNSIGSIVLWGLFKLLKVETQI